MREASRNSQVAPAPQGSAPDFPELGEESICLSVCPTLLGPPELSEEGKQQRRQDVMGWLPFTSCGNSGQVTPAAVWAEVWGWQPALGDIILPRTCQPKLAGTASALLGPPATPCSARWERVLVWAKDPLGKGVLGLLQSVGVGVPWIPMASRMSPSVMSAVNMASVQPHLSLVSLWGLGEPGEDGLGVSQLPHAPWGIAWGPRQAVVTAAISAVC